MEKITSFKQLKVWQKGIEIAVETYRATKDTVHGELPDLASQMRRAAASIPSSVAQGFRRYDRDAYRQHLYDALASIAELETLFTIAEAAHCMTAVQNKNLLVKLEEESKMISSLAFKLKAPDNRRANRL